jgi:hypothetical protein
VTESMSPIPSRIEADTPFQFGSRRRKYPVGPVPHLPAATDRQVFDVETVKLPLAAFELIAARSIIGWPPHTTPDAPASFLSSW